jgi:hypothetical protein
MAALLVAGLLTLAVSIASGLGCSDSLKSFGVGPLKLISRTPFK